MRKNFRKITALIVSGGILAGLFPFSASGINANEPANDTALTAAAANAEYNMDIQYSTTSSHKHSTGSFVRIERQEATCELPSMDVYIFTCSVCGEEFPLIWRAAHENFQPSFGHDLENPVTGENECGTYAVGHCKRCGKDDAVNGSMKHSWQGWWIEKQPTCQSAGILKNECTKCHMTKTEDIAQLDFHNIKEWKLVSPADCENEGVYSGTCVDCGAVETRNTPALGHRYDVDLTVKPATCTEEGLTYRECTRCGKKNESSVQTTPAKGHCYTDDGDCTTPVICKTCGETVIEAKEHQLSSEWSSDGSGHYHACLNEGCTVKSDLTPHTGSVIDGDCTKGIMCTVCGGIGSDNAHHDFSGKGTYYAYGRHSVTCSVPGCKVKETFYHVEKERTDCTEDVVCEICDSVIGNGTKNHNFSGEAVAEGDHHVYYCRNLKGKCTGTKVEEHKPANDDGDCRTTLRCVSCKAVIAQAQEAHSFSTAIYTDANGCQYRKCVNATCTAKQYIGHEEYDSAAHNYVNGKCTICGSVGEKLGGHSLTLDGKIEVNFYMLLDSSVLNDNGAYMKFTTSDGLEKVFVSTAKNNFKDGYYVFTCSVAPKDVNSEIKAQLVLGDGTKGNIYKYSISEYANSIGFTTATSETKQLVDAMMNYGQSAESYFANDTVAAPAEEITAESLEKYKSRKSGELPEGIEYVNTSLVLDSAVSIRHYFKVEEGTDISGYNFILNVSNGLYFVEIKNITAKELGTLVDTVIGDFTLTYSPMSYAYAVLSKEGIPENLVNLVKSLYIYNQASEKL